MNNHVFGTWLAELQLIAVNAARIDERLREMEKAKSRPGVGKPDPRQPASRLQQGSEGGALDRGEPGC